MVKNRQFGIVLGALLLSGLACNISQSAETEQVQPTGSSESEEARPSEPGIEAADLAAATVQILALLDEGTGFSSVWSGSGSIVSEDGLILTNAHVVEGVGEVVDALGVSITQETDVPPELTYLAEVLAIDYDLDLAVLRVATDLDGNPVSVTLPWVEIGDSDQVEIGDRLRILGYPGIGGETITLTEGSISGFTAERSIAGRAWIKTDATIAGGNSGGMGTNQAGQLIGVPTIVTSGSERGESVDCRPLADTNRDGFIDGADTCVSVGGFINALRPINLALPLIDAARSGTAYVEGVAPDIAIQGFDLSEVNFTNLVFSDGVTEDDQPMNLWYALPTGATEACIFWDYEGMTDGMAWSVFWFQEGEYLEEGSLPSEMWNGGDYGNWWACIFQTEGLEDGLYEVSLEVEAEIIATESVFVGGNREVVDFILVNDSSLEVCYVQLSPSFAQNWGPDELGGDEVLFGGEQRIFELATGIYDVRLSDCDSETLAEEYEIDLQQSEVFTFEN
jgi:S1-C subfamily serine protease